jgi:DNA-binding LacI/PurR family transcriptional regulator/signal transduction histidine kinase
VRTFGALSPFASGDYYGAIIAGVNRAAALEGNRVIAIQTLDPGSHGADFSGVPEFRRPVAWRHMDGVVVLPGAVHADHARAIQLAGKSVVLVAHQLDGVDCAAVLVDNRTGVREAVAHLVEHGHQRIAFAGNLDTFDPRERHEGYREGLAEHGIAARPELLLHAPDNHETGGEAAAEALIRAGMPATAIVMGTDRNALGLVRRLAAAGHELPRDLAVVGFDDFPEARYARPSLSTVRQPLGQLGAAAYELVRDAVAGSPTPRTPHRVATQFVQRESCGCPARGLEMSEAQVRAQFADNVDLQMTLNIQYELGIELLGTHARDPRTLAWLRCTPALAGCLGMWTGEPDRKDAPADTGGTTGVRADSPIEIAGEYRAGGDPPASAGAVMPVSEFPPPELLALADGTAGEVVFLVPVRNESRDWGVLAAVGRIQHSTPPGREMMNQSGALLVVALERKAMLESLQEKEAIAIRSAHYAGMAEIAVDVLHNVGNILTSMKVSRAALQDALETSRVDRVGLVAALLERQAAAATGGVKGFLTDDPRGRSALAYLAELSTWLQRENQEALAEVRRLGEKVTLIERVIAAQQARTSSASFAEATELSRVVDEVLTLRAVALASSRIEVVKRYGAVAPVYVHRARLAHVLANLFENAEEALIERSDERRVVIDIGADAAGAAYVRIEDNGGGIAPEHLTDIFGHGFTTRKDRPGFGLHYCANSMTEMGGRMAVESAGRGQGAAFLLVFGQRPEEGV